MPVGGPVGFGRLLGGVCPSEAQSAVLARSFHGFCRAIEVNCGGKRRRAVRVSELSKIFRDHKEPLYGRQTAMITVRPFRTGGGRRGDRPAKPGRGRGHGVGREADGERTRPPGHTEPTGPGKTHAGGGGGRGKRGSGQFAGGWGGFGDCSGEGNGG